MADNPISKRFNSILDDCWSKVSRAHDELEADLEGLIEPGMRVKITYDPYHSEYHPVDRRNPPSVKGTYGVTTSGIIMDGDHEGWYFFRVNIRDKVGERSYQMGFFEVVGEE